MFRSGNILRNTSTRYVDNYYFFLTSIVSLKSWCLQDNRWNTAPQRTVRNRVQPLSPWYDAEYSQFVDVADDSIGCIDTHGATMVDWSELPLNDRSMSILPPRIAIERIISLVKTTIRRIYGDQRRDVIVVTTAVLLLIQVLPPTRSTSPIDRLPITATANNAVQ